MMDPILINNRPGPSLLGLSQVVGVGMFGGDVNFATLLMPMMVMAGMNFVVQINDCEDKTDYTESADGVFDIETSAVTGHRVGTNTMKFTQVSACDGSQYIQTIKINESEECNPYFGKKQQNWNDTRYLGFWKHAHGGDTGDFGTDGELQVAIVNNGKLSSIVDVDGTPTTAFHWCQIDMEAEGWERDRVEALRFYCSNENTGETTYLDDIIRYLIAYDRGPWYGSAFPIMNGVTLAWGETVKWTIDGLAVSAAADAGITLGPVALYENGEPVASLVGTGKRDKWGIVPGARIFIGRAGTGVTAADMVAWESSRTYNDVTTATVAPGCAMGLESSSVAGDDVFLALLNQSAIA